MKWRITITRVGLVLVCGVALLSGGRSLAQREETGFLRVTEPQIDLNQTGQIVEETADSLSSATMRKESVTQASSSATFGSLALTVQVDQTYCGTGGVQCTGTGHTAAAAGPTNHNPVRLGIQVLRGGSPVGGLPSGDFTVSNPFVPAGGPGVTRVECPTCFQTAPGGLYTIFVHPAPASVNWKSGSYFVQVQVRVPFGFFSVTQHALAQIDIPF